MSKNIFDETKTILENICIDFDELTIPPHRVSDLHFYTIYKKEIDKIYEALEQAEKQEKLLELYKEYFEYSEMLKDGRKFGGRMLVEHERDKIIEEIKEKENEKKQ